MSELIDAIERFEVALKDQAAGLAADLDGAESTLRALLLSETPDDHDSDCKPCARGCTEGVVYNWTVYAPGFTDQGEPVVVTIPRVCHAGENVDHDDPMGRLEYWLRINQALGGSERCKNLDLMSRGKDLASFLHILFDVGNDPARIEFVAEAGAKFVKQLAQGLAQIGPPELRN
jgi:hypothetical protein